MIREHCSCGWPKPLIAVTRVDGSLPEGELVVRVLCPACETPYAAGERARGDVAEGAARIDAAHAAAASQPIDMRHFIDSDDSDADDEMSNPDFDFDLDDGEG